MMESTVISFGFLTPHERVFQIENLKLEVFR